MRQALLIGAAAVPVGLAALLGVDGIAQWCQKRFWGRMDASSRAVVWLGVGGMLLGAGISVGGLAMGTTLTLVAECAVITFLFSVALQLVGLLRDRHQYGRYLGRHR